VATEDDPFEQLGGAVDRLAAAERSYEQVNGVGILDAARDQLRTDIARVREAVRTLCAILIERGQLGEGHRRLIDRVLRSNPAGNRVRLRVVDDKHGTTGPDIDCASRLHLCQGRCCSYTVELGREDVADGIRWHVDQPYVLLHDDDGWCHHMDRASGGCTVYPVRPAACRAYDCRKDARVWIDFDARIPAPLPPALGLHGLPPFAVPAGDPGQEPGGSRPPIG